MSEYNKKEEEPKQNKDSKESRNPFSSFTGKGDGKKPKFSFYWIYGILAVVFIAIQFMNWGGNSKQTDWKNLKEMLESGDVEKIVLVNKEYAEIYIRSEKLNDEKYKDVQNESAFGQQGAQYFYNVASPEKFIEQVEAAQQVNSIAQVYVETETGLPVKRGRIQYFKSSRLRQTAGARACADKKRS